MCFIETCYANVLLGSEILLFSSTSCIVEAWNRTQLFSTFDTVQGSRVIFESIQSILFDVLDPCSILVFWLEGVTIMSLKPPFYSCKHYAMVLLLDFNVASTL